VYDDQTYVHILGRCRPDATCLFAIITLSMVDRTASHSTFQCRHLKIGTRDILHDREFGAHGDSRHALEFDAIRK